MEQHINRRCSSIGTPAEGHPERDAKQRRGKWGSLIIKQAHISRRSIRSVNREPGGGRDSLIKRGGLRCTFIELHTYFIGGEKGFAAYLGEQSTCAYCCYPRALDRSYLFVSGPSHFTHTPLQHSDFLVLTGRLRREEKRRKEQTGDNYLNYAWKWVDLDYYTDSCTNIDKHAILSQQYLSVYSVDYLFESLLKCLLYGFVR